MNEENTRSIVAAAPPSQIHRYLHYSLLVPSAKTEAEFSCQANHGAVTQQDVAGDAADPLVATHSYQQTQQLGTQSLTLEAVADENGALGLVRGVHLDQPSQSKDLAFSGLRVLAVGHEHHLAGIVNKADAYQLLMGDAP